MSWFSDFAKTALNEAQKRIDKVLDIDDENPAGPRSEITLPTKNAHSDIGSSPTAEIKTRSPGQFQSSMLPSQKSNLGNSSSKKQTRKPSKLGSSLSRKPHTKPVKQSANEEKEQKCRTSLSSQSTAFEEISLNDSNSLSNDSHPESFLNSSENTLSGISDFSVAESNILSPRINQEPKSNIPEKNISKFSEDCADDKEPSESTEKSSTLDAEKLDNLSPFHPQLSSQVQSHSAYQVTSDSLHSPCGSTTTSSEIDILDHESTISEASTASKLTGLDSRLPMIGGDLTFPTRNSPDPVDSEASDIVRISGYCSSPLSVSSFDGTLVYPTRTKSPIQFSDNQGTSPIKTLSEQTAQHDNVIERPYEESELEQSHSTASSIVHISQENMHISGSSATLKESAFDQESLLSDVNIMPEEQVDELETPDANKIDIVRTENSDFDQQEVEEHVDTDHTHVQSLTSDDPEPLPSKASTKSEQDNEETKETSSHHDEDFAAMNEKFDAYEQQLVSLSLSNANLREENDNLRSELSNLKLAKQRQFEEEQQNLLDTVDNLSQKVQNLELEKSEVDDELKSLQAELATRLSNEQVQSLLSEKEESIQGLLQEGETLSKTHLQQNNTIKKLRAKLSEQNVNNKELTEKVAKFEEENKSLKFRVAEIQGQSSEDRGTAERLSEAFQEREMLIAEMRSKLEDAEEKRRAAQSTLDAAYKDLSELNKKQAALKSDREAELKEHEIAVTKKMQQEIEKIHQDHEHQLHMRLLQLGELQDSLERTEAICTRKEDQLRKEVKDLQQRLQESELRNHELSGSISESTRPILRQMENLQSTYSTQTKTWEALEKSLTSRLGDAQIQLVASQDKERSLQMAAVDLKARIVTLEQQLADERTEKASFNAELVSLRTNAAQYDDKLAKLKKELEVCQTNCEEVKSKARRDKVALENQLDMEKVRSEVEKKKYFAQLEAVQKEKERILWLNRSDSMTSSASMLNVEIESVASSSDTFNNFEVFERSVSTTGAPSGVYDSVRSGTSGPSLLENLQSQLKMRDGEIAQLQGEINTLERTRSSMAEEIVRLTNDNEDLQEIAQDVANLKISLKEMENRHEAVLTMYGEKAEEAEELKLDLQDVKTMYRNQIDTLLKSQ